MLLSTRGKYDGRSPKCGTINRMDAAATAAR
jgi:hypothetical protein